MRVVKLSGRGVNLRLSTVVESVPHIGDHEVLVKVSAASLHCEDAQPASERLLKEFKSIISRQSHSSIRGNVFSGTIIKVGSSVQMYEVGDHVFGIAENSGVCAEYIRLPDSGVLTYKPVHLSHAEAATIPYGALQAQHFMDKAAVVSGKSMIIFGANHPTGIAALQMAAQLGVSVTVVCSNLHAQMMFDMGAMDVIDPKFSIMKRLGYTFDIVLDCSAELQFFEALKYLSPSGVYLRPSAGLVTKMLGFLKGIKVYSCRSWFAIDDLQRISSMVQLEKYKPVVDRVYSIDSVLPAFYFLCSGRAFGGVAIQLSSEEYISRLHSL